MLVDLFNILLNMRTNSIQVGLRYFSLIKHLLRDSLQKSWIGNNVTIIARHSSIFKDIINYKKAKTVVIYDQPFVNIFYIHNHSTFLNPCQIYLTM